ncbi:unnamed protein product [Auanema sp. JU1783]|nr:unnamed protein product [Auanema sp. JU1783]
MRLLIPLFSIFAAGYSHFEDANCSKTKECIFVPPGCEKSNSCVMKFSYKAVGDDTTEMELFSSNNDPTNNYVAVGFSKDASMGNDHVTQCVFPDNGQPEAHLSFNFGKSNSPPTEPADLDFETNSLKVIHAHKMDGGFYCHISQKSSKPVRQYAPDLDTEHTIFLVRGKARRPRDLGIHTLDPNAPDFPFISNNQLNVGHFSEEQTPSEAPNEPNSPEVPSSPGPMNATAAAPPSHPGKPDGWFDLPTKHFLIKLHGALMISAWLFFVALAILSARYLREHFPSSNPGGLKWWFHLHRIFNVSAVFLILVSTALIFVAKEFNWTGPVASNTYQANSSPGSVHSLVGTIAILVAIIQPIMSMLRCAPDTGARPIFNWSHRILGIFGLICALVAVVIAGNSFVGLWSDSNWSFSIVIFYIVIFIAALIGFEILSFMKVKQNKSSDLELHKRNGHHYDDRGHMRSRQSYPKKSMYGTLVLYIIFGLFAACLCTALCIMLLI